MLHTHFTRSKVNLAFGSIVDAADVEHEHAVDVDPHVIIAPEVKDHVLAVDLATLRHVEVGDHLHAKVVVGIAVATGKVVAVSGDSAFNDSSHIARQSIEREELGERRMDSIWVTGLWEARVVEHIK